jgi:hypothetical protein
MPPRIAIAFVLAFAPATRKTPRSRVAAVGARMAVNRAASDQPAA